MYPNTSTTMSPEPNSLWFMVSSGGNRVICETTGYAAALIAFEAIRNIQRTTRIFDWTGRVVRPLSGEVGFTRDLQRALYYLAVASNRRGNQQVRAADIRSEATAGVFGPASTKALANLVLRVGRWTAPFSITEGEALLPDNLEFPLLDVPLDRTPATVNPVCRVIDERVPPQSQEQAQQQAQESNQLSTPLSEPPNKGPAGNKAVFDEIPFDESIEYLPPSGTFDSDGSYQPAQSEIVEIVPIPGTISNALAPVPPPPANLRFMSQTSGGTGFFVVGLGLLFVLSLLVSTTETKQTTTRRNPRRNMRRRARRR